MNPTKFLLIPAAGLLIAYTNPQVASFLPPKASPEANTYQTITNPTMWQFFKKKNTNPTEPTPSNLDHEDLEEVETEMTIRTPQEVAKRILALYAVIGKVYQGNNEGFLNWFKQHNITQYLSHHEIIFMQTAAPAEGDLMNFSWRAEALTALLWSAQLIEEMPALNEEFDVYEIDGLEQIIANPSGFITTLQLRADTVLTEMEDKLYNAHWQVRDAQLFGKKMPAELDPGIVYERRYALSWLIGWGEDWDEVPTDT